MHAAIGSFRGKYRFLSNMYVCPNLISYQGMQAYTVEHLMQAAKTHEPTERRWVLESSTPKLAKSRGRRVRLSPGWDDERLEIVEDIVREKFTQDELSSQLIATEDAYLAEGNSWGDTFWGVDSLSGRGENHLGIILMKIRNEISSATI